MERENHKHKRIESPPAGGLLSGGAASCTLVWNAPGVTGFRVLILRLLAHPVSAPHRKLVHPHKHHDSTNVLELRW
jgi:hypothetical protein